MILGLLTCSKKKLPVVAPAWLMYSVSPRFSQQYSSLRGRCDAVRIVSAKYGVIEPDRVIEPYDQLALDASPQWLSTCSQEIKRLAPDAVVSYLTSEYRSVLTGFSNVEQLEGSMYSKASSIGRQGHLKRGEQVVCWPMSWILIMVAEERPTPQQLSVSLRERGYGEGTVKAQVFRARICPLHEIVDGRLQNRYQASLHS